MIFEQLDTQDREICEALRSGTPADEIMAHFGVNSDKIDQLVSVVKEMDGNKVSSSTEAIPENTQAPMAMADDEAKSMPDDAQPQSEDATA